MEGVPCSAHLGTGFGNCGLRAVTCFSFCSHTLRVPYSTVYGQVRARPTKQSAWQSACRQNFSAGFLTQRGDHNVVVGRTPSLQGSTMQAKTHGHTAYQRPRQHRTQSRGLSFQTVGRTDVFQPPHPHPLHTSCSSKAAAAAGLTATSPVPFKEILQDAKSISNYLVRVCTACFLCLFVFCGRMCVCGGGVGESLYVCVCACVRMHVVCVPVCWCVRVRLCVSVPDEVYFPPTQHTRAGV